jgi:hypothetical protein
MVDQRRPEGKSIASPSCGKGRQDCAAGVQQRAAAPMARRQPDQDAL